MNRIRTLLRYWHGVLLGILATFATAVPALADVASDQKSVFAQMLPIFIFVATVAYTISCIRGHDFKALFKGVMVGGITFVVSLFLVDIL